MHRTWHARFSMVLISCGLLTGWLGQQAQGQNIPYKRRVILLWDTSQSMVKRLNREKSPPETVIMARNEELQRLETYVRQILFDGFFKGELDAQD